VAEFVFIFDFFDDVRERLSHAWQHIAASGCSTQLLETDELSLLSEGSAGHVDAVLADEALAGTGDAAAARVLTVLSGVRVELLLHCLINN